MRLTRTRRYMLLRNAAKQLLPQRFSEHGPLENDPELEDAEQLLLAWPAGVCARSRCIHSAMAPAGA